jgi:histone-lysine N-methyltransferase SETD3
LWPLLGFGTSEQALSAAVAVGISIVSKDIFFSRAAGLKRYVVCPYIDMFNHKSTCISDVSYGYFSNSFELRTQGHKKGEQVKLAPNLVEFKIQF